MQIMKLTPDELLHLKQLHRHTPDRRSAYRIHMIIMLSQGWTNVDIAKALLLDEETL